MGAIRLVDWRAERKRVHRSSASGWSRTPHPWLLRRDSLPSVSSSLSPFPSCPRVVNQPSAGCLGPTAPTFLFPGAGLGRTGSARIWVSGADNLQREIEWSTPIIVPGLFLPSSRLAARFRERRRRRCRKRIAGPPRHYSDSLSSLPAATNAGSF